MIVLGIYRIVTKMSLEAKRNNNIYLIRETNPSLPMAALFLGRKVDLNQWAISIFSQATRIIIPLRLGKQSRQVSPWEIKA